MLASLLTREGLSACGLGEGVDVGLQSLGSYIVGEAHHGTFFPLSSLLGVAGELIGGPLMAALLAVRDQSGKPLGYCFLLSSVCFRYISHYIYKLTLLLDPFYVSPLRQPLYQD